MFTTYILFQGLEKKQWTKQKELASPCPHGADIPVKNFAPADLFLNQVCKILFASHFCQESDLFKYLNLGANQYIYERGRITLKLVLC